MKSANEKKMEAYNQMCVRLGLQPSSEADRKTDSDNYAVQGL